MPPSPRSAGPFPVDDCYWKPISDSENIYKKNSIAWRVTPTQEDQKHWELAEIVLLRAPSLRESVTREKVWERRWPQDLTVCSVEITEGKALLLVPKVKNPCAGDCDVFHPSQRCPI